MPMKHIIVMCSTAQHHIFITASWMQLERKKRNTCLLREEKMVLWQCLHGALADCPVSLCFCERLRFLSAKTENNKMLMKNTALKIAQQKPFLRGYFYILKRQHKWKKENSVEKYSKDITLRQLYESVRFRFLTFTFMKPCMELYACWRSCTALHANRMIKTIITFFSLQHRIAGFQCTISKYRRFTVVKP